MSKSEILRNYIENLSIRYDEVYQYNIIKRILEEKIVTDLPQELKGISLHKLSRIMYSILYEDIRNEKDYNKKIIPLMLKKKIKTKFNFKKNKKNIIALMYGVLIIGLVPSLNKANEKNSFKEPNYLVEDILDYDSDVSFAAPLFKLKKDEIDETIEEQKEIEIEEQRKRDILNNVNQLNTIEDILNRQQELESLNLNKIYEECPLSASLQWFIYERSTFEEYPLDFTFAIIDTETLGEFNSSGLETYNGPGDSDIGLTQQNSVYALKRFCKKYNVSYDEAYELVRDNDYINIMCCFLTYDEIEQQMKSEYGEEANFNLYYSHAAGRYNGWVGWKNNNISESYVERFGEAYTKKYTKNH